jgi:hypothetical protein
LREDTDKQGLIVGLEEEVKKCFVYGNWGYFRNEKAESGLNIISLVRAIYKKSGYEVNYRLKMKNGVSYTEYSVNKKNV